MAQCCKYWLAIGDKALNHIVNLLDPSWPEVCLLISVLIILFFKRDISRLISRLKSIDTKGAKFHRAVSEKTSLSFDTEPTGKQIDIHTLSLNDLESIKTQSNDLRKIFDEKFKDQLTDETSILFLLRELAIAQFGQHCERILLDILGSQIDLMYKMSTSTDYQISTSDVHQHYEKVKKRYPDAFGDQSIDDYLFFLLHSKLIKNAGENYILTTLGKDFLTWRDQTRQNVERPL